MQCKGLAELELCFADSPMAFCVLRSLRDEQGVPYDVQFLYANAALAQFFKIPADEILQKPLYSLYPFTEDKWLRFFDEACYKTGAGTIIEYSKTLDRYINIQMSRLQEGICACMVSDVTEQQEVLQQYEDQLYLYRTSQNAGVFRIAVAEGLPLLYANDRFFQIMEYTKHSLNARCRNRFAMCIHPDDLSAVMQALEDCIRLKGRYTTWQARVKTGQGNDRYIQSVGVIRMLAGRMVMEGTFTDLTEQKLIQRGYADTQDTLMAALDHADLYFWEYDIATKRLNNGYKSVRDFKMPATMENFPEAMISGGYIHPDSVKDYVELCREMEQGRPTAQRPVRIAEEFGGEWYNVRYTNFYDEKQRPVRAFATAENLHAYKELEQRLSVAMENEGIVTWTLDIPARCIVQSDHMVRLFGDENVIENVPDVMLEKGRIHPEDAQAYRMLYTRVYAGEAVVSCRLRKRNILTGKWDWYRVTYTVVHGKYGKTDHAIGSAININAMVEAELKYSVFRNYRLLAFRSSVAAFRLNLTKNMCDEGESQDPRLLGTDSDSTVDGILVRTCSFIPTQREIESYNALFNRVHLLELFGRGVTQTSLEHRFLLSDGRCQWIRTSIDMMENPDTHDVEAVAYATNIDRDKTMRAVVKALTDGDYEVITVIDHARDALTVLAAKPNDEYVVPADGGKYSQQILLTINSIAELALRKEIIEKQNSPPSWRSWRKTRSTPLRSPSSGCAASTVTSISNSPIWMKRRP